MEKPFDDRIAIANRQQAAFSTAIATVAEQFYEAMQRYAAPDRLYSLPLANYEAAQDFDEVHLFRTGEPEPILILYPDMPPCALHLSEKDVEVLSKAMPRWVEGFEKASVNIYSASIAELKAEAFNLKVDLERVSGVADITDPRVTLEQLESLDNRRQALQQMFEAERQQAVDSQRPQDIEQTQILGNQLQVFQLQFDELQKQTQQQEEKRENTIQPCRDEFPHLNWDYDFALERATGTFQPTIQEAWSRMNARITVDVEQSDYVQVSFSMLGKKDIFEAEGKDVRQALMSLRGQLETFAAGLNDVVQEPDKGDKQVARQLVEAKLDPVAKEFMLNCWQTNQQALELPGQNYTVLYRAGAPGGNAVIGVFRSNDLHKDTPIYQLNLNPSNQRFKSDYSSDLTPADMNRLTVSFSLMSQKLQAATTQQTQKKDEGR